MNKILLLSLALFSAQAFAQSEPEGKELAKCAGTLMAGQTYLSRSHGYMGLESARSVLARATYTITEQEANHISLRALLSLSSASPAVIISEMEKCKDVIRDPR